LTPELIVHVLVPLPNQTPPIAAHEGESFNVMSVVMIAANASFANASWDSKPNVPFS